jgi:hypothetical protein
MEFVVVKIAYMTQTEGQLPDVFRHLTGREHEGIRLFQLCYRDPIRGALFLPESTWTEGRNALLRQARESKIQFDYYVFCDDDIIFQNGGWLEFEELLRKWRPAVAAPLYPVRAHENTEMDVFTVYSFDAIFNAFHSDIIDDEVILPYFQEFDSKSWWFSQLFVIHLCAIFYPRHVLQTKAVAVSNGQSRPYPRNEWSDFVVMHQWIRDNMFLDKEFFDAHFHPPWDRRNHMMVPPSESLASYKLSEKQLGRLNLKGPFWNGRR